MTIIGWHAEVIGTQQISPESIPSGESFGVPMLTTAILAESIASAESFGTPIVEPGGVSISPESIPSAESFGVPSLREHQLVLAESIGSAESFGVPEIIAVLPVQFKSVGAGSNAASYSFTPPVGTDYVLLDVIAGGDISAATLGGVALPQLHRIHLNNNTINARAYRFGMAIVADGDAKTISLEPGYGQYVSNIIALSGVENVAGTYSAFGQGPRPTIMSHGPIEVEPGGLIVQTFFVGGTGSSRIISDLAGGTIRYNGPQAANVLSIMTSNEDTTFTGSAMEAIWDTSWASIASVFN